METLPLATPFLDGDDDIILPIALIGYGAMGREIERITRDFACEVRAIHTSLNPLTEESARDASWTVAIDFTRSEEVQRHVEVCARTGKHIVIGTTGWHQNVDDIRAIVEAANIGCVYGSNFSIGVQMFQRIVRKAAELARKYDEYDVAVHEWHHRRKADSPSGTAHMLAQILTSTLPHKNEVLATPAEGKIAPNQLHVSSTRVGAIPGTHTVMIDSESDSIELTHRARNRTGFAIGALRSARWVADKSGFFEFSNVFDVLM